jgi:predicted transcriptional regulator
MFHDLSHGTYNFETVKVYFGFDNYRADLDQIIELSTTLIQEYPGVTLKNMEVCSVTHVQSDRHARQTMVCAHMDAETVRNNLNEYTVL